MDQTTGPVSTSGVPLSVALAGAEEQLERLGPELAEIEMLEAQARGEAVRHEQHRAQAADRLAAIQSRPDAVSDELRDAVSQLVLVTRRASMMESQVDILDGKQKALRRYRDHLVTLVDALRTATEAAATDVAAGKASDEALLPASVSRAILSAQEDMRRDIARAMHDGPAQSLANIVLQAQIVERLVRDDPEAALREAGALVEVVQHALDATKTFIFNVRPMVLDDLGLVPTLRRLVRDRGRDAAIPVDFESVGADRRLEIELETGLFRIIDEALAGYLTREPSRVTLTLTWEPTSLAARVQAVYVAETVLALPPGEPLHAVPPPRARGAREQGEDLPPALAAMIVEQRAAEAARASLLAPSPEQGLPPATWREIEQRARSLAIGARTSDDGRCVDLAVELRP